MPATYTRTVPPSHRNLELLDDVKIYVAHALALGSGFRSLTIDATTWTVTLVLTQALPAAQESHLGLPAPVVT